MFNSFSVIEVSNTFPFAFIPNVPKLKLSEKVRAENLKIEDWKKLTVQIN
jgi:hypothetical protein